jgi:outer membrane protein assembly factor BamE (lipoprotein component of BamABCDE complex)
VKSALLVIVCAALPGCAASVPRAVSPGMAASEVSARIGKPVSEGRLSTGQAYWDYTREPYGYYRVVFGTAERVHAVHDLHTEQNFINLRPGMTDSGVVEVVGRPSGHLRETYGNGTSSWTYRYRDAGIAKLLHVTFGSDRRLLRYDWEWDPAVYSKADGAGKPNGR